MTWFLTNAHYAWLGLCDNACEGKVRFINPGIAFLLLLLEALYQLRTANCPREEREG